MSQRRTVVAIALVVFAVAWGAVAGLRLSRAHADFSIACDNPPASWFYSKGQVESFLRSSSLKTWRSLRPLIKNPFRKDVRLYFVHHPMINADGVDAWATNERGSWELKLYN